MQIYTKKEVNMKIYLAQIKKYAEFCVPKI